MPDAKACLNTWLRASVCVAALWMGGAAGAQSVPSTTAADVAETPAEEAAAN